jgi:hypothetical protein
VATSEPVVLHHGREGGGAGGDEVRPSASTACWAASLASRYESAARLPRFGGRPDRKLVYGAAATNDSSFCRKKNCSVLKSLGVSARRYSTGAA